MTQNGVVAAGGRLTDWVSLGVLASSVPRDAVDDAIAAAGKGAKRSDGKLPPHVMVYLVMALALFADDDYEEVAARLTETLTSWGCWADSWSVPTSGGITQARQRLGSAPLRELFSEVAVPVAEELTRGAFLGPWRLMTIDGFEWDAPDTPENAAEFGYSGAAADGAVRPAFPKVRVVTVGECASHAVADAEMGGVAGKGAGGQALGRGFRPGPAVAGEIRSHAAGAGAAARRVVLLGAGQPEGPRPGPRGADRGCPRWGGPGGGRGPACPGDRVRGSGPGR